MNKSSNNTPTTDDRLFLHAWQWAREQVRHRPGSKLEDFLNEPHKSRYLREGTDRLAEIFYPQK